MNSLLIALGLPFAMAWFAGPLVRWLGARAGYLLAIVPIACALLVRFTKFGLESNEWVSTISLSLDLRLDRLSAGFAEPVLWVGAGIFAYSAWYMKEAKDLGRYFAVLLMFMGAMLGILLAESRLTQFMFWEITGVASFLLIGTAREDLTAQRAAVNALLITSLGGLGLLASAFIDPRLNLFWGLILLAAATKSAQLPFSGWLPGAMAAPTPISAYLHSATMVQAGVYLVARNAAEAPGWFAPLAISLGLATSAVGVVGCLIAVDLKQILAFSTLATLGMFFGLAASPITHSALLAYFVAHAVYKAGLFCWVGVIDHSEHSRDIRQLQYLGAKLPGVGLGVLICALSSLGIPPLLGFVAKELVPSEAPLLLWVAVFSTAASSVVVFYRIYIRLFWPPKWPASVDRWILVAGLLLVANIGAPLELRVAAEHFLHAPLPLLSSILVGIAITYLGTKLSLSQYSIPAWPSHISGAVRRGMDRLIRAFQDGHLSRYLRIMAVTIIALIGYAIIAHPVPPTTSQLTPDWLDVLLAISIIGGALAGLFTGSRLAAVSVLGAVGLAIALLFARYSAPDLAMTLIATETLTLIFVVFTLARFPKLDHRQNRVARFRDGLVATGIGGVMAALTLTAGLTHQSSRAADFYTHRSLPDANGRNVVNVILVDFRGFDTLGETTVLAVAGLGIWALLRYRNAEVEESIR